MSLEEFNVSAQCAKYGVPLWQCPNFLFLVMGLLIIAAIVISYILGTRYISDPLIPALIVIVLAGVLVSIAFVITDSFERLAEASRLKTEFVGIVSHQLRAPLSNIKWALDLLVSKEMDKKEQEYFSIVRQNSGRMEDLVSDLLVVSRIEQGTLPEGTTEFSFRELVRGLVEDAGPRSQALGVTVELDGEEGMPPLRQNEARVRHAVQVLVDNAVKYSGSSRGGREGRVRVSWAKQGKNLRFEVRDNGAGVPEQDKRHIFERFFRSANAKRRDTQGSGLGLYIAKSMVELAGGRIGFESKEDKGSMFWFTIPFHA